MALTRRQREVLDVIRTFIEKNGYSPSLEEIGAALSLSSVATVHKHVTHLVDKGLVRRVWNQNRSIELVDESTRKSCVEVPVTGVFPSDGPIPTTAGAESVPVPQEMTGGRGRVFVLRAVGDTMQEEQVRSGDLIVIEDRRHPRDGETVIVAVDGGAPILRRFERVDGSIRLSPATTASRPQLLPPERVQFQGIVVGLLRSYSLG